MRRGAISWCGNPKSKSGYRMSNQSMKRRLSMTEESVLSVREYKNDAANMQKLRSLLEILIAFVPILILGIIGTSVGTDTLLGGMLVTLGYVLSILVATIVLKLQGSSWRQLGLARPKSWFRTALLGIGTLVALFIMNIAIQVIAINLPGMEVAPIDQSRFNPLEGNLVMFLLFVVLAWTTIAFGEEMFYRAFLITQLGDIFQKSKMGTALALLVSSVNFGLVHFVEGPLGVANTFFMGLILGAIYLRTGRNLWITIIAHGLANSIRFYFLFIGAA
jgi:membrane protease YdiL (CAAX protease family)